jgi:hypothetical protein
MTRKLASGVVTLLLCVGSVGACAQEASPEDFEGSLFASIPISSFSLAPERLAQLTSEQQGQLLIAKSVAGKFFKALEDVNGEPLRYMTAEYARRVSDRLSLRRALVTEETTILQVAIRDFTFSDDAKTLELDLYVTVFSEGAFAVSEASSTLHRTATTWEIADVAVAP